MTTRGEGGQKSKDSPFSLARFPVPNSLLVMVTDWTRVLSLAVPTPTLCIRDALETGFSPTAASCLLLRT